MMSSVAKTAIKCSVYQAIFRAPFRRTIIHRMS